MKLSSDEMSPRERHKEIVEILARAVARASQIRRSANRLAQLDPDSAAPPDVLTQSAPRESRELVNATY